MTYPPPGGTPDPLQPNQPSDQPSYGPPPADPMAPPTQPIPDPYAPPGSSAGSYGPPPYGEPPASGQPNYGAPQPQYQTGYPGYPGYAPARGTNVMAILSLVFAFVFAPAGIVLGHMAKKQIKERGEEGDGLATAGLVISYVITGFYVLACCGGVILLAMSPDVSGT